MSSVRSIDAARRRAAARISVGLLLAATACAPRSAPVVDPAGPTLAETVMQQIDARRGIPWSADRRLTVDDFRGPVPASAGNEGARIAYGIFDGARCVGMRFEFRVVAAMLPEQSWISPVVRANPADVARALAHEQTHFDLTEVHARRLRRHFTELYEPCSRTQGELQSLTDRFLREESADQERYDSATRNGRDPAEQATWNRNVATRLSELSRFGG
jgi:hypothetical protein